MPPSRAKPEPQASSLKPHVSPPTSRPLGWAGFLLDVPAAWRLHAIDGRAERGSFRLADAEWPRLEMSWTTVTRRRFNARAAVIRRLVGGNRRGAGTTVVSEPRDMANPGFDPLLLVEDDANGLDRAAGYCPATGRLIECAYRRGDPADDRVFRETLLPGLRDQPADGPSRWAFFGVSFVAPAGFGYASAKLNLGDMRVALDAGPREHAGPSVALRLVYPAEVALARQPLEAWLEAWARESRDAYAPKSSGWVRPRVDATPVQTRRGSGLAAEGALRLRIGVVAWRAPRRQRLWAVHDAAADRLLLVRAADRPDRFDGRLTELLDGLDWAGTLA